MRTPRTEIPGLVVSEASAGRVAYLPADIDRLFAVGVRGSFDPDRAATELEELLVGHTFSDGLDILAQSTPTNNSDAERSPWQPRLLSPGPK